MCVENDNKKVSLAVAASAVTRTLELIEDGGDPDGSLMEAVGDVLGDVRNGVDRRIHFLDILGAPRSGDKPSTGLIGKYEELAKEYKAKADSLKNLRENLHLKTMAIMDENPDLEFRGHYGKFRQQKNSQAELTTEFLRMSFNYSNIITAETMEMYGLHKYITYSELFQLNTEAVREALKSGVELPWAKLNQGKHLRISR
jgi:hypothetical protein